MIEFQKNLKIMAIQYELAMAIGLSLDSNKMLTDFLHKTSSVLNCTAGNIWLYNDEKKKLNCVCCYPKTILDFTSSIKNKIIDFYESVIQKKSTEKYGQFFNEKKYHYFFMIGTMGVVAFQTRHILQDEIITALLPIFLKLDVAWKACLQYGISEISFKELFNHSPIALTELDCSPLKDYLAKLRSEGINDITDYFYEKKEAVDDALKLIKVSRVNLQTINLFDATDKFNFSKQLNKIVGEDSIAFFCKLFSAIDHSNNHFQNEGIVYTFSGKKIHIDLTYLVLPAHITNFKKVLFTMVDITELKNAESRLEFLATHDYLTGLPNRILLKTMLEASINRTHRSNKGMALLFLDIDYFKNINDQFGHSVGDDLLVQIAKHLKNIVREDDFIARVGGDEFVIIINNINSKKEMADITNKIQKKASTLYFSGTRQLNVSVSIGASYYPEKNETHTALTRHADSALYAAKSAGRNCAKFHEPNKI